MAPTCNHLAFKKTSINPLLEPWLIYLLALPSLYMPHPTPTHNSSGWHFDLYIFIFLYFIIPEIVTTPLYFYIIQHMYAHTTVNRKGCPS